jgi:serpin B
MENDAKEAAALAMTSFALELYAELAGDPPTDTNQKHKYKNIVFSPASLFTALTMAWFGADGDTDAELERVLHLKDDADQLLAVLAALSAQIDDVPGCELAVANALWAQEGYPIFPQYLRVLNERLRTAAMQVDFQGAGAEARDAINAWVEQKTHRAIRGLIGDIPAGTSLLLVNAVYFKGAWSSPFDKVHTHVEPFYPLHSPPEPVPLMRKSLNCRVIDDEQASFRALALPYKGNSIEMVILLPRERDGLPQLERELNAENLRSLLRRLPRARQDEFMVVVPKFRIEQGVSLRGALQRIGVTRAFDPALADFSGITPDPKGLCLSAVIHKALIDVDEEGTVAAAATAVQMFAMGPPKKPPTFRADHPFVFLLHDTRAGNVLFLGRFMGP